MDWLNLPTGVPHLETDQPAPSQKAMKSALQQSATHNCLLVFEGNLKRI